MVEADEIKRRIRLQFTSMSEAIEREVASILEEERARIKARSERVERRYDKLAAVVEMFRAHEKRLTQELDEAEGEHERVRLLGMIDGVRYALGEMEKLV